MGFPLVHVEQWLSRIRNSKSECARVVHTKRGPGYDVTVRLLIWGWYWRVRSCKMAARSWIEGNPSRVHKQGR